MTIRMSTGQMFNQSVSRLLLGQQRLAHLSQQLSTGQRLLTAKDDPVSAGRAVALDRTLATLEQYGKDATHVQSRLGLQETALQQATDAIARVKELTIMASNGIVSPEQRQVIAQELSTLRTHLVSLANTSDGNGHYVFAGAADDHPPFLSTGNSDGRIIYAGDQKQREVEVAPETLVKDGLPGSEIFMHIRTGDGNVEARADTENTGTGVLLECGRSGRSGSLDGNAYCIEFDAPDHYRVLDATGNAVSEGDYASGESILFSGMQVRIEGEPAPGDRFEVGPAQVQDIFSALDGLVSALQLPTPEPADIAHLNNALHASLRNMDQVSEHFIRARAACGAQMTVLEQAAEIRNAHEVTFKTELSGLRDLDYVEAVGRHQLESIALDAAQSVFLKMQGMSLFERMG